MSELKGGVFAALLMLLVALAITGGTSRAFAQEATTQSGAIVNITGEGGAIRAFGAIVTIDGAASSIRAAGASVQIRGAVEGGISAAGADVLIEADAGGGVRAAGARLVVGGRAAGDLRVAGAVIDVSAATGGELRAAGASVTFEGQAGQGAIFSGAVVTINGRIDGQVTVNADRLFVGPDAVIAGNLLVRSLREPVIDPAATISGQVTRESPRHWLDDLPQATALIIAGAFAASILLSGLVLLVLSRKLLGEAVDNVRFRPARSLLYGILGPIILFLIAAILMATVIGFPVGLALLLLLPAIAIFGQPVAGAGLVGWIFGRTTLWLNVISLILFLILGAMLLMALFLIPVVGPLVATIALLIGIGGFLRALIWRLRALPPLV